MHNSQNISEKQNRQDRIDALAAEALHIARGRILANMRYLDSAIYALHPVPGARILATDGKNIYYDAADLLRRCRTSMTTLSRDYMHIIVHCLFRHGFVQEPIEHNLWNLAADMAAEALIDSLSLDCMDSPRGQAVREYLDEHRGIVKTFTAEKLYSWLRSGMVTSAEMEQIREIFTVDDHEIWYRRRPRKKYSGEKSDSAEKEREEESADAEETHEARKETHSSGAEHPQTEERDVEARKTENDRTDSSHAEETDAESREPDDSDERQWEIREREPDDADDETPSGTPELSEQDLDELTRRLREHQWKPRELREETREETEERWKEISERLQMNLAGEESERGMGADIMRDALAERNRERVDYGTFLRKFVVRGETLKVDPDAFDYIFYTYGLQLYGNVPLIEPLEYAEENRIRDLVIAIDTSGSTRGATVEAFLKKTFRILKTEDSFHQKINVHIIQCDAKVQSDTVIHSIRDIDDYMKNLEIRGYGGTDFRPLFAYVDQLIRQGAFGNLRGVIYFTDGYGTFPSRKPDYETAFVFIDGAENNLDVPPWAIRLILGSEEIGAGMEEPDD